MRNIFHLAFFSLLVIPACSSGGGGGSEPTTYVNESEPNDDAGTAVLLTANIVGRGSIGASTDADWWQLELEAGQSIQVEVCAARVAQSQWAHASNLPSALLIGTDGATVSWHQRIYGDSGLSGTADPDILLYTANATGSYYIKVEGGIPQAEGGDYIISYSLVEFEDSLQAELEPEGVSGDNDSDATAEVIVPGILQGFYVDDEEDWFKFTLDEPALVELETLTYRNGTYAANSDRFDPLLGLYDSSVSELDVIDDAYYYDSGLHFLCTATGDYYISLAECCGGEASAPYYLSLRVTPLVLGDGTEAEAEPNDTQETAQAILADTFYECSGIDSDTDYFSFSAQAGDAIRFYLYAEDALEGSDNDMDLVILDPDSEELELDTNGDLHALRTFFPEDGVYTFQLTSSSDTDQPYYIKLDVAHSSVLESEPNDSLTDADVLELDQSSSGYSDVSGDVDIFSFQAEEGEVITLSCMASAGLAENAYYSLGGFASDFSPWIEVVNAAGESIGRTSSNADTGRGIVQEDCSVSLTFISPTSGTYYVKVREVYGRFGEGFHYLLRKQ